MCPNVVSCRNSILYCLMLGQRCVPNQFKPAATSEDIPVFCCYRFAAHSTPSMVQIQLEFHQALELADV